MSFEGPNDASLPDYIIERPPAIRARWVIIFNDVFDREGEEMAFIVANKWLVREVNRKDFVRQTFTKLEFEVKQGKQLIKQTDGGDEYIDFVLVDTLPDSKGISYEPGVLKQWADEINSGKTIVGDFDHLYYDKLMESGLTASEIEEKLQNKPGIAKSLKAVFEKGKLWVRTIIDKRYKKQIEKAKGVSLEAYCERDENNKVIEGNLLGFTFGVTDTPVNPRAVIA